MVFTTAQKVTKHLSYFYDNFLRQEIPKIDQSSHTVEDAVVAFFRFNSILTKDLRVHLGLQFQPVPPSAWC